MRKAVILILFNPVILLLFFSGCVTTKSLQTARDAYDAGHLEQAYSHYAELAKANPSNAQVLEGLEQTRRALLNKALSSSRAIIAEAQAKTLPVYRAALKPLEQANQFDPNGDTIPPKMREIESTMDGILEEIEQRKKMFARDIRKGDFASARQNLDFIRQSHPELPDLNRMETTWSAFFADSLEKIMLELLVKGNIDEIKPFQDQWNRLSLPEDRRHVFNERVRHESLKILRVQAKELMSKKEYYRAYQAIVRSGATEDLSDLMSLIKTEGRGHYASLALSYLQDGNLSRAYLETVKGLEIAPKDQEIFTLHRDSRDQMLTNLQKYIAIPAFGAPASDPDLGPQFSDALISYLFRILPYGINIVERQKVDLMINEQILGTREAANRLSVDLFVSRNVSLLKIDRQESSNQVSVRVKVGQAESLNPAYEAWLRLPTERRIKTPPPAQTIKTDKYESVMYTKGRTTLKGFGSVALRIFDTNKGAINYAQEFNATYEVSDDYQDGVSYADIKGDALELPTETEIREKLRNKIIEQVAVVVKKQFEKREAIYLQDAQYHLSRSEKDKAVDNLALGFLYCVKAKVPFDDPDFTQIREKILDLTEGRF